MPTSQLIPDVWAMLKKLQPKSILDIGVGFGKVGFLAREYLELWGHRRYDPDKWQVKIDGIEAHQDYILEHHKLFYNDILIGDITEHLEIVKNYDVIVACDVIEHLSREVGCAILESAKSYIVTTPAKFTAQGAAYNNEFERHVTLWSPEDFENSKIITCPIEANNPILIGWKMTGGITE